MKKINDLSVCLLISFIAHAALLGSGMLNFAPETNEKPFEVVFEVEEEILPELYDVRDEKKIEPPTVEQPDIIEPVTEETITEIPVSEEDKELEISLLRYQDSIKQKIQREKRYPRWALRVGHEGGARIAFTVLSSGEIKDLFLINPSGFKELDKEAMDAVQRASPFFSFPGKFKEDEIKVELDIIFRVTSKDE